MEPLKNDRIDPKKSRWKKEKAAKLKKEVAYYAAILRRQDEEMASKLQLKEKQRLLDERIQEEQREEALQKEIDRKTKTYYVIDSFNRKVSAPDRPVYFGDYKSISQAWVPHGEGQFFLDGEIILEGNFRKGFLVGRGKLQFSNGVTWIGEIKDYKMHGIGTIFIPRHVAKASLISKEKSNMELDMSSINYVLSAESNKNRIDQEIRVDQEIELDEATLVHGSKLAIAKENIIVCLKDELVPGLQLEFRGPLSGISATPFSINATCRAVLLQHLAPALEPKVSTTKENTSLVQEASVKHNWIYKLRFQNDVWPKDRDIDLEIYSNFIILRHLPLIYDFSIFQLPSTCKRVDDFRLNLPPIRSPSSSSIPKNEKGNSLSKDLVIKFPTRSFTERLRNVFEARAAGIGAAAEEEERERLKQLQKKQWAKLIEDRRVAFEEARRKKIEEEQEQLMAEAMKSQKQMAKQKQEEDRAFLDATQKAVEQELLSLGSQTSAIRSKS